MFEVTEKILNSKLDQHQKWLTRFDLQIWSLARNVVLFAGRIDTGGG